LTLIPRLQGMITSSPGVGHLGFLYSTLAQRWYDFDAVVVIDGGQPQLDRVLREQIDPQTQALHSPWFGLCLVVIVRVNVVAPSAVTPHVIPVAGSLSPVTGLSWGIGRGWGVCDPFPAVLARSPLHGGISTKFTGSEASHRFVYQAHYEPP
jgi:hypothetical protein